MLKNVLITGGAGFIGSHVVDQLLEAGYRVRVLDNLSPQVHLQGRSRPDYLNTDAELIIGDVRDSDTCRRALKGMDAVCHLAAAVGVGQSMYKVLYYTDVNELGTAVLLQSLEGSRVRKLVVASSMSVYGEGLYQSATTGQYFQTVSRDDQALQEHQWEPQAPDGSPLQAVPTPEDKPPVLQSVYALNKYAQERLSLIAGTAKNIDVTALRFFNVYGPRQALSNPYTGVLANFAARLLNKKRPIVHEDGLQQRDFVHVNDVARAVHAALEYRSTTSRVFNIGSGESFSIKSIAIRIAEALNRSSLSPEIAGTYRRGDIRHCFADISLAKEVLGWQPQVSFDEGIANLVEWLSSQTPVDNSEIAQSELRKYGLTI